MIFRTLAVLAGLLAGLCLLEFGSWFAISKAGFPAERPNRGDTGFWWGDHPELGVWKRPDVVGEMSTRCTTVSYRMNSDGARDVERPKRARTSRVVVLGDSFFEGWGIPESDRVSNRLERATGRPHLNFAMAHFGPWQSLLAYESIASAYDHDTVLLGLLPVNDFIDLDLETPYGVDYVYRFRPYLIPEGTGWRESQLREPRVERWLRQQSHFYHLVRSVLRRAPTASEQEERRSAYRVVQDRQLAILEEVLIRMARATAGKRLVVVVIPAKVDFVREGIRIRDGEPISLPLIDRLQAVSTREGFEVVDLLPPMVHRTPRWGKYFLPCDYHWSGFGNLVASEILAERLYH